MPPEDRPFPSLRPSRRSFLRGALGVGGSALIGCPSGDPPGPDDADGCPDPYSGGRYEGDLEFLGGDRPLDETYGEGLDGRRYVDLTAVDFGREVLSNGDFFVRTRASDLLPPEAGWEVRVEGLCEAPRGWGIEELRGSAEDQGVCALECSGNGPGGQFGLLSAARWGGVPVQRLLDEARPSGAATQVLVEGFDTYPSPSETSTPGASWVFPLGAFAEYGGFLATTMNGEPLPADHGAPVRLVMPRWYGCSNIKWVQRIELVDDSAPSTSQMREFAGRTHQPGVPELARDFLPATQDQAAMPVRVERWTLADGVAYRIVGVMWGGQEPTDRLVIRFDGQDEESVDVCPAPLGNDTWTLWEHLWRPTRTGVVELTLHVADPGIPSRRLDSGFYARRVRVEVA